MTQQTMVEARNKMDLRGFIASDLSVFEYQVKAQGMIEYEVHKERRNLLATRLFNIDLKGCQCVVPETDNNFSRWGTLEKVAKIAQCGKYSQR